MPDNMLVGATPESAESSPFVMHSLESIETDVEPWCGGFFLG